MMPSGVLLLLSLVGLIGSAGTYLFRLYSLPLNSWLTWIDRWQTLVGSALGAIIIVFATYLLHVMSHRREVKRAARNVVFDLYGLKAFLKGFQETAEGAAKLDDVENGDSAADTESQLISLLARSPKIQEESKRVALGLIVANSYPALSPTFETSAARMIGLTPGIAGWLASFRMLDRELRAEIAEMRETAAAVLDEDDPMTVGALSDRQRRCFQSIGSQAITLLDLVGRVVKSIERLALSRTAGLRRWCMNYRWCRKVLRWIERDDS